MSGGLIWLGKSDQDAEDRVRGHDDEGEDPRGRDDPVGMGAGLPGPGLEWVTDGAVPLDRYGNQAEGGDAH